MVLHGFAQQSSEELNHANDLFLQNKIEDACDLMTKLTQKQSNDRYQNFKNTYCSQARLMLANEKRFYDEGTQLAASGRCDEAKQDSDRISHLFTRDPKYRNQLAAAVAECQSKLSERSELSHAADLLRDHKFADARSVLNGLLKKNGSLEAQQQLRLLEETEHSLTQGVSALLSAGKDAEARATLDQVAADSSASSDEARKLLVQLNQRDANDRKSLDEAALLIRQGKNGEAQRLLGPLAGRKGPLSAKASALLKQIAGSGEEWLRAGLTAYFHGDLQQAESNLTSYININGERDALAYFFRGATRASVYYLSGEIDASAKRNALEDFRTVKQRHRDFLLPEKYVSPKVISLFEGAG
jgi:hypothetical protein